MKQIIILARHSFTEVIRKKDFYVFLIFLTALIMFFYHESFFKVADISRYLKDIGFSLITLFTAIIAVTFSAKQIPSEIESKTVYPLLAKPVSRNQIVLGKFLGGLFISIFSFTVFFALYAVAISLKGERTSLLLLLQAYAFSVYLFSMLSAIAIFLSLFLTLSANISITLLTDLLSSWYNGMLRDALVSGESPLPILYNFFYCLLPHFEFYDIKIRLVHLWDPLPFWVFASVSGYTLLYVFIILAIACFCFRRKNL
jgi:ABC-type transport system involved in multi-copper enzyme maturation permease subunit